MRSRGITKTDQLSPTADVVERARVLRIPVRVLGRSPAPVHPQRVGNWWLAPLNDQESLPPRATARLQALLDAGVKPKAVVVFHEIPEGRRGPTSVEQWLFNAHRLIAAEFPKQASRSIETANASLFSIGKMASHLMGELRPVAGVAAIAGLAVLGHVALGAMTIAAAAVDPCLVIVTEDGEWIEVDRWYE